MVSVQVVVVAVPGCRAIDVAAVGALPVNVTKLPSVAHVDAAILRLGSPVAPPVKDVVPAIVAPSNPLVYICACTVAEIANNNVVKRVRKKMFIIKYLV
jgi:hypothetical protein